MEHRKKIAAIVTTYFPASHAVNGTIRLGNYSETKVCIYGGEKWSLMALIDIL